MLRSIILTILALHYSAIHAQSESGNTERQMLLDSVIVESRTTGKALRTNTDGTIMWDMQMMDVLPKILGNADPLHYAQMLPGISTNGEYDAGFRVLGNETCHNYMSINGAPLYGVSHIIGIFSVFNAPHFRQMSLQKSTTHGATPNRLGAIVNMQTRNKAPEKTEGEFSVGLISSQGTIRIPIDKRSHLTASFRGSYLNLLYSSFLDDDETSTKYSFYDANINYFNQVNDNNSLCLDLYMGNDNAKVLEKASDTEMKLAWGNFLAALKWQYDKNNIRISNSMYYTRTHNDGGYDTGGITADLPSSISELGNKFAFLYKDWTMGLDASLYRIKPQTPYIISTYKTTEYDEDISNPVEMSLYVEKRISLSKGFAISSGIRASLFHTSRKSYHNVSPTLNVTYENPNGWDVTLNYALRHQYLIQTGLSTLNTPLEFWLGCGTFGLEPQSSHGITLTGRYTTRNKKYSFTVEAYNRWLSNQVEYNGTIYSFISTSTYNLSEMLLVGKGHNYGANIVLSKNSGFITGWISYAFSKTMRTYATDALSGTFPASHERIHEIDGIVVMHFGKRWDVGITGVWASGTPFTAPEYYYILQNKLIPHFARHNSNRLRPYYRIDASVNYILKKNNKLEHGLNLSVYNITGHKNDLFHYMKADIEHYQYKSMTFALRIMPSLSYYLKF